MSEVEVHQTMEHLGNETAVYFVQRDVENLDKVIGLWRRSAGADQVILAQEVIRCWETLAKGIDLLHTRALIYPVLYNDISRFERYYTYYPIVAECYGLCAAA